MLKRAQRIRATGLETFIDVLTLRPGDMWNPKIFEAIDESDLFVVIWSTHARDSEWVKKESHYALRHYKEHGNPDFVPIPVEGPPIASVRVGRPTSHDRARRLECRRIRNRRCDRRSAPQVHAGVKGVNASEKSTGVQQQNSN